MLAALAFAQRRRSVRATAVYAPAGGSAGSVGADALARQIAALDAGFARLREPDPAARAAYETRRATLKRDLAAALAARGEPA